MIALAKQMAIQLTPEGLRSPRLHPLPAGSWDQQVTEDPEEMEESVTENLLSGRVGAREELGELVANLVSPRM